MVLGTKRTLGFAIAENTAPATLNLLQILRVLVLAPVLLTVLVLNTGTST